MSPPPHPQPLAAVSYHPRIVLAVVLGVSAGVAGEACAERTSGEESAVKAAFVYNFAKFVDWPDELWNSSAVVRVCIAGGRSGLPGALANLDPTLSVRGKPLEMRAISRPSDAVSCHVLVLAGRERMSEWTRTVRLSPVLTVGESEGFAAGGGVIGLFIDGEKIKFEINPDAAQRAGLKLSSQLLKLARLVKDDPGGSR